MTPILFGYPNSPFSEKIRLMFGHTGLPWRALTVPPQPPRHALDPVLDGYRRIPVLQIGADYICDSRLIAHEIALMAKRSDLSTVLCAPETAAEASDFDTRIFRAGVIMIPRRKLLWASLKSAGFGVFRLISDRQRMAQAGGFKTDSSARIAADWQAHLDALDARCAQLSAGELAGPFLGGPQPNAADFSAYHTLWFAHDFARSLDLQARPHLARWYQEISALGHGTFSPISEQEAFDIAQAATPRVLGTSEATPLLGETVQISPTDYARNGTTGRLVHMDATRYVIARDTARCGAVQVHFPKQGFELS